MDRRIELHYKLIEVCGTENVYYQAPEDNQMQYPAIKYSRSDIKNTFANDDVYRQNNVFEAIVIDEDPDSEIVYKLSKMRGCKFSRHYVADGLNHDVFIINYN